MSYPSKEQYNPANLNEWGQYDPPSVSYWKWEKDLGQEEAEEDTHSVAE